MGVREESKIRTRQKIIDNTKMLLLHNGFVKVSTKEIASQSEVSQGSIFLHFGTKDNLLNTILSSNIESLELEVKEKCKPTDSQDLFLRNFLDVLIEYENILSRVYKDYSYLSETLCKQIDSYEAFVKNLFYENFKKKGVKRLSIVDSFIAIDAYNSQLKYYLLEKKVFSDTNSIIRQRRGRIVKLYKMLFE